MSSAWQEAIDQRPGRTPLVRDTETARTFELSILGGEMARGKFVATPRTRLVIHCERDGRLVARILEGRSSAA